MPPSAALARAGEPAASSLDAPRRRRGARWRVRERSCAGERAAARGRRRTARDVRHRRGVAPLRACATAQRPRHHGRAWLASRRSQLARSRRSARVASHARASRSQDREPVRDRVDRRAPVARREPDRRASQHRVAGPAASAPSSASTTPAARPRTVTVELRARRRRCARCFAACAGAEPLACGRRRSNRTPQSRTPDRSSARRAPRSHR